MAYDKKSSGCTPITAKIKKTTQGGMVTQPLLNMGAPVKMKLSSPAKNAANRAAANEARVKARAAAEAAKAGANKALELKKAKELASKEFIPNKRGRKVKNPAYQAQTIQPVKDTKSSESSGASMTPYSVKDGKGIIHGPKVSYDMAYKNRDMKTYGGMNKAEYIKESKRQTKSFESTGKFDAPKPPKKQKTDVAPKTEAISIETNNPTVSPDVSTPKPAKKAVNKTARAARVRQKGIDALANGNSAKALRLKRREARINKRAEKQEAKTIESKKDKKPKRAAKGSRAATLRK